MNRQNKPTIQATEVSYELHTLGWKAFQSLCSTITGQVWGQTVQMFFESRDGGRDGAFHGSWVPTASEAFEGTFTVQCKFTAKPDKQLSLGDLKDELQKAKRLAAKGLADNYILMTNARLGGVSEEKIKEAFQSIPGVVRFAGYGAEWLSRIIKESPRLRMLVPRVYGLGDLSQILDERAYSQAIEILSSLGDDLAKFVITDAYQQSAKALVEHGFVLLLGEPASGKSTIAAALAVGALDEWGCSTLKIRDPNDFVKHSNPHEPKQFFWVDDAFGATQYDWASTAAWNRVFPHVQAAIRRGARILFTSRDYIYRSARQHLKLSAFPVLQESQVIIQVERLSKGEREQILYNHVRLGTQPTDFKRRLKPFLSGVAKHSRFSPEIARRLGNPLFTKELLVTQSGLNNFVERPMELLCEIIRTLDSGSRSALALIFMRGGALPSPIIMSNEEDQAVQRIGGSIAGVVQSTVALEGSLVLQTLQGVNRVWRFKHPSIRDAFAALVAEDPELLDIYLTGTPIDKLLGEISCGPIGMQGIKVIIPPNRYDSMITRLSSLLSSTWQDRNKLYRFLAYRCDQPFLEVFIEKHPSFVSNLSVGSYLYAVSDVGILVRLHDFGILPEEKRTEVVAEIAKLAVDTPDSGFLREDIKRLLTTDDLNHILRLVRDELLPQLDQVISDWQSNYSGPDGQDPEEYFQELKNALNDYQDVFANDGKAMSLINKAYDQIESTINDLQLDSTPEPDEDFYGSRSTLTYLDSRSIFDDVDE